MPSHNAVGARLILTMSTATRTRVKTTRNEANLDSIWCNDDNEDSNKARMKTTRNKDKAMIRTKMTSK